jgi:hypothetical protein
LPKQQFGHLLLPEDFSDLAGQCIGPGFRECNELADIAGALVPEGVKGTVYITTRYKCGAPQIRFKVNDISAYFLGNGRAGGASPEDRTRAVLGIRWLRP